MSRGVASQGTGGGGPDPPATTNMTCEIRKSDEKFLGRGTHSAHHSTDRNVLNLSHKSSLITPASGHSLVDLCPPRSPTGTASGPHWRTFVTQAPYTGPQPAKLACAPGYARHQNGGIKRSFCLSVHSPSVCLFYPIA